MCVREQILIDDMELIEIRRNHEKGEGEDAPERERGRVGVKASCFPIPHRVESISELSENIRGAEDLIPDLLEVQILFSKYHCAVCNLAPRIVRMVRSGVGDSTFWPTPC